MCLTKTELALLIVVWAGGLGWGCYGSQTSGKPISQTDFGKIETICAGNTELSWAKTVQTVPHRKNTCTPMHLQNAPNNLHPPYKMKVRLDSFLWNFTSFYRSFVSLIRQAFIVALLILKHDLSSIRNFYNFHILILNYFVESIPTQVFLVLHWGHINFYINIECIWARRDILITIHSSHATNTPWDIYSTLTLLAYKPWVHLCPLSTS